MMKTLRQLGKKLKFLRCGSCGSAIIVVLVTMTFIVVLASILLYLSLVNIQMKTMDKGAKTNFYSAEAAMNEIRAGIQNGVSEAIKKAYSEVLVSYNTQLEDDQISHFIEVFYDTLYDTEVASETLFYSDGAKYNASLLINFISIPNNVTVSGSDNIVRTTDGNTVTSIAMKDIIVTYTAGGFETKITSDILINTPVLPYTSASIILTQAPTFTIIAKGLLEQQDGNGTVGIAGNVYAGGLKVGGNGDIFNISDAEYFILHDTNPNDSILDGSVEINGGALTFSNSALWATNIKLNLAGSFTMDGDAYIANDLNLYGSGTKAFLTGRYFGYGNGYTEAEPPPDASPDPDLSSAILINGRDTLLDMSGLRALMLAGHSFVNYNAGDNSSVMMGESISVKPNQLAYLVPDSCLLGISNPSEYTDMKENAYYYDKIDLDAVFMKGNSLRGYGINDPAKDIQYIRNPVGNTKIIYFCLKFPNESYANLYFRDYYDTNTPKVQKYIDLYSNGILLMNTATKNMSGEAVTFKDGVQGTDRDANFDDGVLDGLVDSYGVPPASVEKLMDNYANLCITLSRTNTSYDGAANAYDYFVDTAQLNVVTGAELYPREEADKKVAVVNGNCALNNVPDSVHLIIASGDVTVNRNFTGLIFAGGKVTFINGNKVNMDSALVSEALAALANDDDDDGAYTYYFLNPEHISPLNSSSGGDEASVWNLNALVTYQNWTKNED